MTSKIQTMQDMLTLVHVLNKKISKNTFPYYIPETVAKIFSDNPDPIIVVEFNKVILFGQIKLSENDALLIGPVTTADLFYDTPLKAFSYLKTAKNYVRLKKIIDQQANFTIEDFSDLLAKIYHILFHKTASPKVLKRNNYQETGVYQDKIPDAVMVKQLKVAIHHGDKERFVHLATIPQVYLNSFINLDQTSPEEMRKEFYQVLITASNIALEEGVSQKQLKPIQAKYQKLWRQTNNDPIKAGHIMFSTILEMMSLIKQKRLFSSDDPLVERTMMYVDHNYQKALSRKDIANALNLSPSYLSSYFKEKTGMTLTHFIQLYKINKAEMYLESDELSVIEIANALGFSNVTYFNRLFKKMTGQTPTEYRKTH